MIESAYGAFEIQGQVPTFNPITEGEMTTKIYVHVSEMLNEYYFHPDHLGSSSYITNKDGVVTQHMEYLPFGETLVDEHTNSFNSPFKYNGKEIDEETGNYYYSARYYDPKWSIFISVDPLVEKTMDAYGYCYQNPINLVDPTGMEADDWRIHYTDKDGKNQVFIFNGKNGHNAPDNQFVKDFISAYDYNVGNGGGESIKTVAESMFMAIDVQETTGTSEFSPDNPSTSGNDSVLNWNPSMGLETTNGYVLSPATILEHEGDHGLLATANPSLFRKLIASTKNAGSFNTMEEKRVINGSEQKTANANREIPMFATTRKDHYGLPVMVNSPTSTKVNSERTFRFNDEIDRLNKPNGNLYIPNYKKYAPKN